jgi:hypothetical protein
MLIPGTAASAGGGAATCGVAAEVPKKLGSVPLSEHCPVPRPEHEAEEGVVAAIGADDVGLLADDGRLRMAGSVKEDRVTALGGEGLQQRRRNAWQAAV